MTPTRRIVARTQDPSVLEQLPEAQVPSLRVDWSASRWGDSASAWCTSEDVMHARSAERAMPVRGGGSACGPVDGTRDSRDRMTP
jgi:hypothetical protein